MFIWANNKSILSKLYLSISLNLCYHFILKCTHCVFCSVWYEKENKDELEKDEFWAKEKCHVSHTDVYKGVLTSMIFENLQKSIISGL